LAQVDASAMLPHTQGDPYPRGVTETTLIAVDELHTDSPEAHDLLGLLAVLSPTGVDTMLLAPRCSARQPPSTTGDSTLIRPLRKVGPKMAWRLRRDLFVGPYA
jgi:hypothetical protein